MDFTFLFIIILMLLAVKSGLTYIAVGLLIILLFTSKNKYLLAATVIGGITVFLGTSGSVEEILGNTTTWIVLGGLFLVVLLVAKKDSDTPSPGGYTPGM